MRDKKIMDLKSKMGNSNKVRLPLGKVINSAKTKCNDIGLTTVKKIIFSETFIT